MDVGNTLATEAAKELVRAIVDGLVDVVKRVPALWRRPEDQALMTSELDETKQALDGGAGTVEQEIAWKTRFGDLLKRHPEVVVELQELLASIPARPASRTYTQIGIATDGGRNFMVQDGTIVIHEAREPESGTDHDR